MVEIPEKLDDALYDAIEDAMLKHGAEPLPYRCQCGVPDNMDGDVLHAHQVGAVHQAVLKALTNTLQAAIDLAPLITEVFKPWLDTWTEQRLRDTGK